MTSGCLEVGDNLLYIETRLKKSQLLGAAGSGANLFDFLAGEERLEDQEGIFTASARNQTNHFLSLLAS